MEVKLGERIGMLLAGNGLSVRGIVLLVAEFSPFFYQMLERRFSVDRQWFQNLFTFTNSPHVERPSPQIYQAQVNASGSTNM